VSETRAGSHAALAAGIAVAALVLTAVGLSGVGDAPDPHASASRIARWFLEHRDDVRIAAPFGYAGAIAIAIFSRFLAARIRSGNQLVAARLVAAGGIVVATYMFLVQILWSSLAYQVAATSARDAKSIFVVTIVAVPVLGTGVALLFGGAAVGTFRGRTMPRWWSWLTGAGAVVGACSVVSLADGGFFSPDTQQQIEGNVLLLWLLVSAVTLVAVSARGRKGVRAAGR
jgi:hypothetical protein